MEQNATALPNFGSGRAALSLVVVAQAAAVVVTLARHHSPDMAALRDFGFVTALAQVVAVAVIIGLRITAPAVQRMSPGKGGVTAFITILVMATLASAGSVFALHYLGKIDALVSPWSASLVVRTVLIAAAAGGLTLRYMVAHHRARVESLSKQAAKLQALQSRIRPHFLFNSMNSIAGLLKANPEKAEKALHDLADVFRVLLADARKLVPITAERDLARQYLDIEKLRLGERLKVKWIASNVPRAAMIPSLTLQPLLENAIYHGIEPLLAGGLVKVEIWGEGENINIMITNPLPEVRGNAHHKGNKIAMDNIRERLHQYFGDRAVLQTFEQFGNYHVKIRMPIVRG
jgi:two-component system sensor histidine kinase AlgZ